MKCQQCSKDAPAETDPQSGRLRCAQCHAFFGTGTNQIAAVRHARDILQKWSSADLLDQISSFPQVPPLTEPTRVEQPRSEEEPTEPAETPVLSLTEDSQDGRQAKEAAPEPVNGDESASEPAGIVNLKVATPKEPQEGELESFGPSPEFAKEEGNDFDTEDVPALSIMTPDNSEQPSDSQDGATIAESVEAESAGLAASVPLELTKKAKRRHLVRPSQKRRIVRPIIPAATVFGQESGPAQQGNDTMKKNLRIDQPVDPSEADEMVNSADESLTTDPRAQVAPAVRRYRIDSPEEVQDLAEGRGRIRGQSRPRQRFIDEAHDTTEPRGPHFSVAAPKRSTLTSLTGQFLAYVGVLGLTIGTAIVIYGHFGGYSEYTPTGWLVTTVAQMLLFLGIINLVSGGIEQNNHDVSHRINVLGEQLMRIEQVTESAMRGPKIPAERYAGVASADSASDQEAVTADARR